MTHHFLSPSPENTESCKTCKTPCRSHQPRYYTVILPEDEGPVQEFRHPDCHSADFPEFDPANP